MALSGNAVRTDRPTANQNENAGHKPINVVAICPTRDEGSSKWRDVRYWHLASFRCAAKFGRYWVHNGHSRDIGIKLTTQVWYMTTHPISPDVDQDRFYLEQDLIMSGAVSRFGFVRGVGVSSMPDARVNLTNDPYLTDGLRLVLFLNTPRRAFDQIEFLDWERVRQ